jgi:hypothetical protein
MWNIPQNFFFHELASLHETLVPYRHVSHLKSWSVVRAIELIMQHFYDRFDFQVQEVSGLRFHGVTKLHL